MLFKNYKKNTKLFYIVILFFIIFFLNNYQIYKKTFFLLSRDYEKRMVDEHGYCSRESFGFINYVIKKHNLNKTPRVINFEKVPNNYWAFFRFDTNIDNNKFDSKYLILLNYTENPFSNKANNKINNINVYDYEVLEKNKNCYLLGIK
tara:strand:+ start:297 stop:740 length:444 start_codon:yes stop_codon:yes gene_type:complete